MKIDEKALEAACQEFKEHLYIAGTTSEDERIAIKAAIEAYEAELWRPIAEIDCSKPGRILVWMPIDDLNCRFFVDSVWSEADSRDWQEYAARPENADALFRTIDPPEGKKK